MMTDEEFDKALEELCNTPFFKDIPKTPEEALERAGLHVGVKVYYKDLIWEITKTQNSMLTIQRHGDIQNIHALDVERIIVKIDE